MSEFRTSEGFIFVDLDKMRANKEARLSEMEGQLRTDSQVRLDEARRAWAEKRANAWRTKRTDEPEKGGDSREDAEDARRRWCEREANAWRGEQ